MEKQVLTAKAVFDHAHEITARVERMAYVEQACADAPDLREKVVALLRAYDEAGSSLDLPRLALPPTSGYAPAEGPGSRIGPYKLLQQIGEGGMGVVFMAEQQEPVRRKVALKIIKPGMDSHQVIARFEAERQALAMMDHQNIARVLDAGTTESGRPYFVMELVHGVPITQFCDDNKLTPRERLALFVPVCQAIQHAHQKGIIHRDVKPSNVLVTMYDDKPVPKVIDFGVAKAVEQRLTEKTMFTQFGALVGTFEYMSPEQAEMNAFGVDTRSDIYSLGVLLYELLTGTTPLERTRLREAALDEMVRLIREEEAPRPSVRLSSSNNLAKVAAARKTEPARLSTLVRGEIDWIVMKCLEKDRARRYDTASGLARDVERYLADEAVEACPPSARYRLSKFARKHKKALATAAAFVLLLVAGVVLSTLLAVWARSAEREANRERIASDETRQEALDAKAEADRQRDEARLTAYASGMQLAQRAWEENNVVRARELLEEVPKSAAGRDLRGFEWYYLDRLFHSELLTLEGHTWGVHSVAFSPDAQRLASASHDGNVKIWDSVTGKELVSLKAHDGHPVYGIAFSPDGQRLASCSNDDTNVKIWDSVTGKELVSLKGHNGEAYSVAFSPDGRRLASCGMDAAKIWDSTTGKELVSLENHGEVYSVAFSPDGRRLASAGSAHIVKVWDSPTGKELASLKGHDGPVFDIAFSPDGQRLASGSSDRTVKIWDVASGKELFSLKGHLGRVRVAYSPDGQYLASGSDDNLVKIWNSATGKELYSLKGHAGSVTSLTFSPDGQRLASGSDDQTVKIWDGLTNPGRFSIDGSGPVAFSPDGHRLADAERVWDTLTGKALVSLKGPGGWANSVAFSPDGRRLAAGSWDTSEVRWDSATGKAVGGGRGRSRGGTGDRLVIIWDSATGKELLSLKGHAGAVHCVAFSPDGRRLVSGSGDKTVKIWDSGTGKELVSFNGHGNEVSSVAFSPDGHRLASGSWDQSLKIWDSATGKELLSLKGHIGPVRSVAFSPDGQRLASGSGDHTLKIWDSATGKELVSLKGHGDEVLCVTFSPDGQRLASGSWDQTVKIWDSVTGRELITLKGHGGTVHSVAFSRDGHRLASMHGGHSTEGAGLSLFAHRFYTNCINLWESRSVPEEIQRRRVAIQAASLDLILVGNLFRQHGLRADVLEQLRTVRGMSPSRRQEAIAVAQTYTEDPGALNDLAWQLVKLPGYAMPAYQKALRYSEAACQLEPKHGPLLNTLGVAYYRLGNYEKALEMLVRSEPINKTQFQGSIPADLAFLAMTQQQLGHAKEAEAELQRLRERMKDSRWAQDAEAQGFLREAEALLAKPKTPGGR